MRNLSVSQMKQSLRGTRTTGRPGGSAGRPYPGKDTKLGQILDLLGATRGMPVRIRAHGTDLHILGDIWGIDVRRAGRRGVWVLAGEWFGARYTRYLGGVTIEDSEPPTDAQVEEFCAEWEDMD